MNVAFRVDSSSQIGTGHVMRCLTLAEGLREKGADCRFICREHPGNLLEAIHRRGFSVDKLPVSHGEDGAARKEVDLSSHSSWLGVPWQQDGEQTLEVLAPLAVDWLIVDHYALDVRWERAVAPAVDRIMVIDDLADRAHQADVLLNQNVLSAQGGKRNKERVDSECTLLLGPRYALLGKEYNLLAKALPERDGQVLRGMIFVGGSDPHHLTERYLKAISAPEFGHIQLDVVMGKNHNAPGCVAEMVSQRPGTRLYTGLSSLAALMVRADLMLGAGGATNWERMCLGLNSLVVSVARNQDRVNRDLAEKGLICFLGQAEHVGVEKIRSTLKRVINDQSGNCDRARSMRKIVDGRGCHRVVGTLYG